MNVDVEQSRALARQGQGDREIDRDGALAHPAFAGKDQNLATDPGHPPPDLSLLDLHLLLVFFVLLIGNRAAGHTQSILSIGTSCCACWGQALEILTSITSSCSCANPSKPSRRAANKSPASPMAKVLMDRV